MKRHYVVLRNGLGNEIVVDRFNSLKEAIAFVNEKLWGYIVRIDEIDGEIVYKRIPHDGDDEISYIIR